MTTLPRKIRVMRIIARLNIGGPAIHVVLLTQKLDPETYDSKLVTGSLSENEGDMMYFAEERGVKPLIVPTLQREIDPIGDLRTLFAIYRLIREFKPDVVHTHTAKAGFVGRLAAKLAGVPVIVHTFHGHVFHGYYGMLKTQMFIWLERLAASLSDTIITLTNGLRRELAEEYRITRKRHITVLPLGLDLTPFKETKRKSGAFRSMWNIPQDAPLVGIVGRLIKVKNHRLFLEAAKQIHDARPDVHFVIVGDGELRQEIEDQVRESGLVDVVTFTGWQQDLPMIYADLDVKVISSVNEGTPVTLIEAMATGCPVVSTSVGGIADILEGGKYGKLVPSGDANALAGAIMDTLDNPPDTEQTQQAALSLYSIERLARDIDSLYRGLLMRKRVAPFD